MTSEYAQPAGAAPLLPPQVNMLQLPLRDLAPGAAVPGQAGCAPGQAGCSFMPGPHGAVPIASPVPALHPFRATTSTCPGPPCSFRALLLLPWALPAELQLGSGIERGQRSCPARHDWLGMSQAVPLPLLCMAFLIFCHERLQAGDLVLPLCPAWAAISAHTGNKSACLPGGGCTAPAASPPISQSQITPGGCLRADWFCAARPNFPPTSVSVARFCQSVPVPRSSISQRRVPAGGAAGEQSCARHGCPDAAGSRTSPGEAASLNCNSICSSARSAQVRGPRPNFHTFFLSGGAAQSVFFAGNHLESFSLKTVSPHGVPLMEHHTQQLHTPCWSLLSPHRGVPFAVPFGPHSPFSSPGGAKEPAGWRCRRRWQALSWQQTCSGAASKGLLLPPAPTK